MKSIPTIRAWTRFHHQVHKSSRRHLQVNSTITRHTDSQRTTIPTSLPRSDSSRLRSMSTQSGNNISAMDRLTIVAQSTSPAGIAQSHARELVRELYSKPTRLVGRECAYGPEIQRSCKTFVLYSLGHLFKPREIGHYQGKYPHNQQGNKDRDVQIAHWPVFRGIKPAQ
jgi:hypothetical protein